MNYPNETMKRSAMVALTSLGSRVERDEWRQPIKYHRLDTA
jgi:hypothetical protein